MSQLEIFAKYENPKNLQCVTVNMFYALSRHLPKISLIEINFAKTTEQTTFCGSETKM